MSFKDKIYTRKGVTALSVIMAVLVLGSGILASKNGIFADTANSNYLTLSVLRAQGTNKNVFKMTSKDTVTDVRFWWNCSIASGDDTLEELVARCGEPFRILPTGEHSNTTRLGDIEKGYVFDNAELAQSRFEYKKTLPTSATGGKFVVFANRGTTPIVKSLSYTNGTKSLAAYNGSDWYANVSNVVNRGTKFELENLAFPDGMFEPRLFAVWYNCSSSLLTADKDTYNELKAVCGDPEQDSNLGVRLGARTDRMATYKTFTTLTPGNAVFFTSEHVYDPGLVAQKSYTPANLTSATPTTSTTVSTTTSATTSRTATAVASSTATPSTLTVKLNALSPTLAVNGATKLRATWSAPGGGPVTLKYYCNTANNQLLEQVSTTTNPKTTSGTCQYMTDGTYTAKVIVSKEGFADKADTVTITVGQGGSVTPTPGGTSSVGTLASATPTPSSSTTAAPTNLKAVLRTATSGNGQGVNYNVAIQNTDGSEPSVVRNKFHIWWNCANPSSVYSEIVATCGTPLNNAPTDDEMANTIGRIKYADANNYTFYNAYDHEINGNLAKLLITRDGKSYTTTVPYSYKDPAISAKLEISPETILADQTVTVKGTVTDPATRYNSTNYTFWWDCNESTTSVEEATRLCGQPRVWGQDYTQTQRDTGIKYDDVKGGTAPAYTTVNEKSPTQSFPAGPRTIKLIVERRTQAVETRVHINVLPSGSSTVSQTPDTSVTPTSSVTATATTTTVNKTLAHGYNIFGAEGKILPSAFTAQGISPIWGFNTIEKPSTDSSVSAIWNRYPQDNAEFEMTAGNGYYVYNTAASRTIALNVAPGDVNARQLRPGWNLLWTPTESTLSDLKGTLYPKGSNQCIRNQVALQDLVDKGIAYDKVYVIQETNPNTSSNLAAQCQVFRLLGAKAQSNENCTVDTTNNTISNMGVVTKVWSGKAFWLYIFPGRMYDERINTLTTGVKC